MVELYFLPVYLSIPLANSLIFDENVTQHHLYQDLDVRRLLLKMQQSSARQFGLQKISCSFE